MILITLIAVLGTVVDQLVKLLAVARLEPNVPVRIVGDWLTLRLIRNPGAAFSMGESMTIVFTVLAAAALVVAWVWLAPRVRTRWWAVAVGLGIAGVTGNFIDRILRAPGVLRGHVVDMISVKGFAIFNVADMMLTSAAILVLLLVTLGRHDFDGRPRAERDQVAA